MATLGAVERWDEEADVVVLGSGLAGCVSAIEAHDTDASADVLILEKMPEEFAGGSSRCSGQFMFCPRPDELEDLLAYQRALNEPNPVPEDLLRTWGEAVVTQRPWLEHMAAEAGGRFVHLHDRPPDFRDLPGAWCVEPVYSIEGRSGIWRTFKTHADRRGVRMLYETPAYDLVQDGDTLEIFGVLARQDGRELAVNARRAVIMCTGGFEANLDMQRNYGGYERIYSFGTPANVGDGVRMLQKAGAELWHMRSKGDVGGIFPAIKVPEFESVFHRGFLVGSSYIEIAKDNRRYYDEKGDYEETHYKLNVHGHWVDSPLPNVLPVHMIFDDATRTASPFARQFGWNRIALGYEWSADCSAEIEKGWVLKADSLRELAAAMGRDADAVEAAVARWNDACAAGRDDECGRRPERMAPIVGPPYYAVELVPGISTSNEGGKRNARSQVIAQGGDPIPRLYEAGEFGSTLANLYQSGSFLTEAIVFGRIAGRNAAQEAAWEPAAEAMTGGRQ